MERACVVVMHVRQTAQTSRKVRDFPYKINHQMMFSEWPSSSELSQLGQVSNTSEALIYSQCACTRGL